MAQNLILECEARKFADTLLCSVTCSTL